MSSSEKRGQTPPVLGSTGEPLVCELVDQIRDGNPEAVDELSRIVQPGIRVLMQHHLGRDVADEQVRKMFSAVVRAIRRGSLRNSERIAAFVHNVLQHQTAPHHRRREQELWSAPDQDALRSERTEMMRSVLLELSPRERDALSRFYRLSQTEVEICETTGLDLDGLRSRIKARFAAVASGTHCKPSQESYATGRKHGRGHSV